MRWVIVVVLVLALIGFVAQGLGAIRAQRDIEAADRATWAFAADAGPARLVLVAVLGRLAGRPVGRVGRGRPVDLADGTSRSRHLTVPAPVPLAELHQVGPCPSDAGGAVVTGLRLALIALGYVLLGAEYLLSRSR